MGWILEEAGITEQHIHHAVVNEDVRAEVLASCMQVVAFVMAHGRLTREDLTGLTPIETASIKAATEYLNKMRQETPETEADEKLMNFMKKTSPHSDKEK